MKFFKRLKSKKTRLAGFTILEFLISMAIFALMMIVATDTIIRLIRTGEKADTRVEVNRNVEYVAETIKRTARQGNIVPGECGGSTCKIQTTDGTQVFTLGSFQDGDQTKGKVIQTSTIMTPSTNTTTIDLTNKKVDISTMNFLYSGGFLEITIKAYDTQKMVYKDNVPYTIITGVLSRQ